MSAEQASVEPGQQMEGTRRHLVQVVLGWLAFAPIAAGLAWDVLRYLVPPQRRALFRKVFVARVSEIPGDDVRELVDLRGRPVAIVPRPGGQPIAVSLVCTHLGCRVHWQPKSRTFLCPCHMGIFDEDGKVTSGPPPSPLPRYQVSIESENIFIHFPET